MTEASPIPPPQPDDDEDVHWALSTASALWARGDTGEALKWLRRAAETASDQNRDQRSLDLFKAAADATSHLEAVRASEAPPGHGPPGYHGGPGQGYGGHVQQTPPPPPLRGSATPPPPRTSATPPPPRTSATPPSPRTSSLPSASRPAGGTPQPGPVAAARALLKKTLPSEGTTATHGGAAAVGGQGGLLPMVGGGASGAAMAPSALVPQPRPSPAPAAIAAKRAERKSTLDGRFQFPDEEVTVQRDFETLRRQRAEVSRPDDGAEIVSGTASTSPRPETRAGHAAASVTPATRAGSGAARATGQRPGASAAGTRSGSTAAPAGAVAASRTVLSAGSSARPSAAPGGGASSAAARAMSRQVTRRIETMPPMPVDDLDEQTSVLSGEEAELAFEGSETGEVSAATDEHGTMHDDDGADEDGADAVSTDATPDPTPDASGTDEPLYAPSIRPQAPHASAQPSRPASSAWPATRVALRRDASGVRIEALGVHAAVPPGAVPALLVAHDAESADALARLLEPR